MSRRRLLWQIYPSYLLITVAAIAAAVWYTNRTLRDFNQRQTFDDLQARAVLFRRSVRVENGRILADGLQELARQLGEHTGTRITVVRPDGDVVADSDEESDDMERHDDRLEIQEALAGGTGTIIKSSPTLRIRMMYVAVPVYATGDPSSPVVGVVRTAVPMTAVREALHSVVLKLVVAGGIIILAAAGLSYVVSKRISRPLVELKHAAERFARGDLKQRVTVPKPATDEIGSLAEAMNTMAGQLDEWIRAIVRERNEKTAVLSSMIEGVFAVDQDERIIHMNRAAGRFLDTDPEKAEHRLIHEIVRNPDLLRFVEMTLAGTRAVEGDVVLKGTEERYLQFHGTVLWDGDGNRIGALVVLNDVTKIRRLEQVRKDFVANVSHELRTPITSIKGFVETLLDGGMDDPEEAGHFLQIVIRQADRLNAIIEDLLSLSRIQRDAESGEIPLEKGPLMPALQSAVTICKPEAVVKNIEIDLEGDSSIEAHINSQLLEQAVINLVNNAVKYSPEGSNVVVRLEQAADEVVVSVQDDGCGISSEHLPRIFERFYRVDKARSRKLGGTGLGLAIVKHIALAHHGRVKVQSRPGEGSTFSIVLPSQPPSRRERAG